jgi:hypothetical protein
MALKGLSLPEVYLEMQVSFKFLHFVHSCVPLDMRDVYFESYLF